MPLITTPPPCLSALPSAAPACKAHQLLIYPVASPFQPLIILPKSLKTTTIPKNLLAAPPVINVVVDPLLVFHPALVIADPPLPTHLLQSLLFPYPILADSPNLNLPRHKFPSEHQHLPNNSTSRSTISPQLHIPPDLTVTMAASLLHSNPNITNNLSMILGSIAATCCPVDIPIPALEILHLKQVRDNLEALLPPPPLNIVTGLNSLLKLVKALPTTVAGDGKL